MITLRRMFEAPTVAPMEFGEYLGILRRRAWVIVVVTVLVVGAALAWSSTATTCTCADRRSGDRVAR